MLKSKRPFDSTISICWVSWVIGWG